MKYLCEMNQQEFETRYGTGKLAIHKAAVHCALGLGCRVYPEAIRDYPELSEFVTMHTYVHYLHPVPAPGKLFE